MISTALALQEATQKAVNDEMVMAMAAEVVKIKDSDLETFAHALFQYSALLATMTTTLVVNAVLTESDLHDLLNTINEMDSMGKDIENGND